MKIISLFINLLFCKSIIAFSPLKKYNIKNIYKQSRVLSSKTLIKTPQFDTRPLRLSAQGSLDPIHVCKVNKINEIIKLTRLKQNIIPITILSLIGGFIANPLWKEWIMSSSFLAAYTMMIIMTAVSMIINDIYDIDVDKINNPNRPLVKGTVTLSEARYLSIILFSIYSYLGIKYLPSILNPIWMITILLTTIYTPILKKIFFIKNLTCATIVSLSIPFIGLSIINYDTILMFITTKITFLASLYIEILLDICDREGDKKVNIKTIPVLFGNTITLNILFLLLLSGNINIIYDIIKLNNPLLYVGTILTFLPFYSNLINIQQNNYSKISIHKALLKINISLLIFLLTIIIRA